MSNKYDYKNYMSICSEKTLQSNPKGFFMQFAEHVAESAGTQWIKSVFGKFKSDKERFNCVYNDSCIKHIVMDTLQHVQEIYRKKSAEISLARRQEAEKAFKSGDKQKALLLCCQSILRAPVNDVDTTVDSGKSLAFALWARCQVLMSMSEFSLALADVQYALKEGLPSHLKAQAYWVMGICYKAIGEVNRSSISFDLAEKLLEGSLNKLRVLEEDRRKNYSENKKESRRILPNITGKVHAAFPSATSKISLKESRDLGRYVVANEKINTGETLIVEDPYVSCLLPECFGTHCHNCFDRLIAPVGCPECSNVAFCNLKCRDDAISTYHKYECKFLDLLIGSGMSVLSHAALRMITQHPLEKVLEISRNRSKEKVYSLCTNAHLRSPEDFLQRTLMAAFLLRCLQKSNYTKSSGQIQPTEEELAIGEVLLFNLQMLQFNAHEIYETKITSEHRFRSAKAAYIGVALYPTVALFNHDCYPSVTRYFVGKKIILNASRPLGIGDAISENYGPVFTRKNLAERQKSLAGRYWFVCRCLACMLDWPSLDTGLEKVSRRIRCPNTKCLNFFTLPVRNENLKCPKCKRNVSLRGSIEELKNCESKYRKATEMLEEEKPSEGIKILCDAIDTFHRVSVPPHRETHLAQEMLRAFLADSGNVFDCTQKRQC